MRGFYSQKCQLEASIALCVEWAGYLVPRHVLPLFHLLCAPNGVSNKNPPLYHFLGVGVGQNLAGHTRHCVLIWTQVPFHLFLVYGPLTNDGSPGCYLHISQDQPTYGAPPMRTQLFSGCCGLADKPRLLSDLQQPPGTLGPLLGDHLVTMGVHINSCSTK